MNGIEQIRMEERILHFLEKERSANIIELCHFNGWRRSIVEVSVARLKREGSVTFADEVVTLTNEGYTRALSLKRSFVSAGKNTQDAPEEKDLTGFDKDGKMHHALVGERTSSGKESVASKDISYAAVDALVFTEVRNLVDRIRDRSDRVGLAYPKRLSKRKLILWAKENHPILLREESVSEEDIRAAVTLKMDKETSPKEPAEEAYDVKDMSDQQLNRLNARAAARAKAAGFNLPTDLSMRGKIQFLTDSYPALLATDATKEETKAECDALDIKSRDTSGYESKIEARTKANKAKTGTRRKKVDDTHLIPAIQKATEQLKKQKQGFLPPCYSISADLRSAVELFVSVDSQKYLNAGSLIKAILEIADRLEAKG